MYRIFMIALHMTIRRINTIGKEEPGKAKHIHTHCTYGKIRMGEGNVKRTSLSTEQFGKPTKNKTEGAERKSQNKMR